MAPTINLLPSRIGAVLQWIRLPSSEMTPFHGA